MPISKVIFPAGLILGDFFMVPQFFRQELLVVNQGLLGVLQIVFPADHIHGDFSDENGFFRLMQSKQMATKVLCCIDVNAQVASRVFCCFEARTQVSDVRFTRFPSALMWYIRRLSVIPRSCVLLGKVQKTFIQE